MPWELLEFLPPECVASGLEQLGMRDELRGMIEGMGNVHAAVTVLEMRLYMQDRLLRDADWASMAHSLEIRTPLIDWHLFSELTPFLYSNSPLTKDEIVLFSAIPEKLRRKSKAGFEVPIRRWTYEDMTREGRPAKRGLRGWAETVMSDFLPDHLSLSRPKIYVDADATYGARN
jgi:asparagine synthase (glutamine-hydrolysing)